VNSYTHLGWVRAREIDRSQQQTRIYSNPLIYVPSSEVVPHFVFRSQTQYIEPSAQIRLYDAEDVFELMNSHDHELTLNDRFEIWKPDAGEKSMGPEPDYEESSMTVSKLSEGLGLTEAGHQGLWGTLIRKSNGQPITGEGIMRMLATCEEILKEEKRTLSRQTSLTVMSSSGTTCIAEHGRLCHIISLYIYVF